MKRAIHIFKHLFAISFALMICVSCSTDEPEIDINKPNDPEVKPEENIEYYVKYESRVSIPISGFREIKISVYTEKGTQTLNVPKTWEGVFGPFNELTTLNISSLTTGYGYYDTSCTGRISICRGNQPFILKAEKNSYGTSYSVSYTVTKEDLK